MTFCVIIMNYEYSGGFLLLCPIKGSAKQFHNCQTTIAEGSDGDGTSYMKDDTEKVRTENCSIFIDTAHKITTHM